MYHESQNLLTNMVQETHSDLYLRGLLFPNAKSDTVGLIYEGWGQDSCNLLYGQLYCI